MECSGIQTHVDGAAAQTQTEEHGQCLFETKDFAQALAALECASRVETLYRKFGTVQAAPVLGALVVGASEADAENQEEAKYIPALAQLL